MFDLLKNHLAEGIGGLLAVVLPLIVRAIMGAIKNKQAQEMLPGIVKGAFEIVSSISKQTPTDVDDKAAKVLDLVADELNKAGIPVNEKTLGRASNIAASIEANASALTLAKDDNEKARIIARLLANGGNSAAAMAIAKAKRAGAK